MPCLSQHHFDRLFMCKFVITCIHLHVHINVHCIAVKERERINQLNMKLDLESKRRLDLLENTAQAGMYNHRY